MDPFTALSVASCLSPELKHLGSERPNHLTAGCHSADLVNLFPTILDRQNGAAGQRHGLNESGVPSATHSGSAFRWRCCRFS